MKYDVITFGAGTMDIYIRSKRFSIVDKNICVPLGSKKEVDDIFLASGGGGTNAAATFANQGFKTAFCGTISDDVFGKSVLEDLKRFKINLSLLKITKEKPTNTSVLLACPGQDRTILVYRGASDTSIPLEKIKSAKWFYLAPLSGSAADSTKDLINYAKANKIKIAFNPGYSQFDIIKSNPEILRDIDVLILNREEAEKLGDCKAIGRVVVITKGGEGAEVSDGKYIYRADSLKLEKVDPNGAGDSFGAGFVSGLIQKNDIEYAMQLAMANSGYNITKWGAKEGLLKKSQDWEKVEVTKELL